MKTQFMIIFMLLTFGCSEKISDGGMGPSRSDTSSNVGILEIGGSGSFKVPLPPGHNWELTQGWKDHCGLCNERGYDTIHKSYFGDYCQLTHSKSCPQCFYAWDFNLPGTSDLGKPVLASADGVVREVSYGDNGGWGNFVVIDHGNNICSRSAHLKDDSIVVKNGQYVCQGLKVSEIGGTPDYSPHLHFQFENCGSDQSIPMSFTDGNGIPVCTQGYDILDNFGNYNFLKLTNFEKSSCEETATDYEERWSNAGCGKLEGCPMNPKCDQGFGHKFKEHSVLTTKTAEAASYLYSECALTNDELDPEGKLSLAMALKISLEMFGLMASCGDPVVARSWYFPYIACSVKLGVVKDASSLYMAGRVLGIAEAAKLLVNAGIKAKVVELRSSFAKHFKKVDDGSDDLAYLETIYYRGGIESEMLYYEADHSITREQFIKMAAAMSPCFCNNVVCAAACECQQESYSCDSEGFTSTKVPEAHDAGKPASEPDAGSQQEPLSDSDTSSEKKPDPPKEEVDAGSAMKKGFVLEIECEHDEKFGKCESGEEKVVIVCTLSNNGDASVNVQSLVIHLKNKGSCQVVDDGSDSGGGYQKLLPGKSAKVGSHVLKCSDPEKLNFTFDVVERKDGKSITHKALLDYSMAVDFDCKKPWVCNPSEGYKFELNIGDPGHLFIATADGVKYDVPLSDFKMPLPVKVQCYELPAYFSFSAGKKGFSVYTKDSTLPDFGYYGATKPTNYLSSVPATPLFKGKNLSVSSPVKFPSLKVPWD